MTLVVARILENRIRIVSDTKITDPGVARPNPLEGALKAVIIDPNLCLCYAGAAEIGKDAVQEVANLRSDSASLDEIHIYLAELSRNSPSDIDFLTAIGPEIQITRVDREGIHDPTPVEFIGERAAFSSFQAAMKNQTAGDFGAEWFRELSKMSGALRAVIEDERYPGVQGHVVTISFGEAGFEYHPSSESHWGGLPGAEQDISGEEWVTIELVQPANLGGYTCSLCTPANSGIGAIGAYFAQPRMGALYYPVRERHVKIYKNVGSRAFVDQVERDYGIELLEPGFEQL